MSITLDKATIIVVEDDPNAHLIALDLLHLSGANRCYARRNVAAALRFAEQLPEIDLFLVDVNMPDQSGYDLLRLVREHDKLKRAKVVAVTAGTLAEDVEKAHMVGFDGFISKPLKPDRFALQVQDVLNGKYVWDSR
ncbi:MAG: response regulator [Chloroflexi bacterium]|nr:response regulator [Chloroflexota bacterium]